MKCVIISAMGEQTFTNEQVKNLKNVADIQFHIQKELFTGSEFIDLVHDCEILGLTRRPLKDLDKLILQKMTNIKGIAVFSTGYEWVDLQYLKSRGIMLSYLPDYCTISVAEHTIGMILTLSRRLHLSYEFANKRIDKTVSLRGFELFQKKAGIIGYGKIGMKVAELLKTFGVYISWFDIQKENKNLCGYCDLDKLLNESDIVIIAASKKRDSKPIIDDHAIAKMKQNVVIVNSARADLVDNHAIARGLKNNKIFSYAVDDIIPLFKQLEIEPGRIFETSHTAWYSTEALARGINDWVDNIIGLAQNNYRNIIDI